MTTVDLRAESAGSGGSAALTGYLAQPTSPGPWPGVVIIHEMFGLDEAMLRHAERIAAMGFLALAPDLYSDGGARRCLVSTMRQVAAGEGRAYADIEAARQWLLQRPDCTGRVGVIGFCMGGGFALVTASRGFDAAAPNYGSLPADLDMAMAGACPVVASYGGKDGGLKGAADKLDAALTTAGVLHDVKEYPDAGHSFLNDAPNGPRLLRPLLRVMNVGPEPASAVDAWARIEAFFTDQLREVG
ncbi:MAG: dienelactone hydrolase family protein [Jatrophihabitantaceae bacterium]